VVTLWAAQELDGQCGIACTLVPETRRRRDSCRGRRKRWTKGLYREAFCVGEMEKRAPWHWKQAWNASYTVRQSPRTEALEKMMLASAQSGLIWVFVLSIILSSGSLWPNRAKTVTNSESSEITDDKRPQYYTMRYAGGIWEPFCFLSRDYQYFWYRSGWAKHSLLGFSTGPLK
jgi:hypothetical protein